ncbi:hypothetical protein GQ457_08G017120 [Hibiscus cannabinus]
MTIANNSLGPSHGGDLVYPGGRSLDNIPVIPEGTVQDRSISPPHLMVVSVEEALVGHFQAAVEPATIVVGVDSINHKSGMKGSYARKIVMEKFPRSNLIQFLYRVHDQIDDNLLNAIIVRLLGHAIGYQALVNRVNALWKPNGELHIIDLENNYFMWVPKLQPRVNPYGPKASP